MLVRNQMTISGHGPINFLRLWLWHPRIAWGLLLHKPQPIQMAEGVDPNKLPTGFKIMWGIFRGQIDVHVHDE
jgi:hypothetical protein